LKIIKKILVKKLIFLNYLIFDILNYLK
jgi:hypothetical protein